MSLCVLHAAPARGFFGAHDERSQGARSTRHAQRTAQRTAGRTRTALLGPTNETSPTPAAANPTSNAERTTVMDRPLDANTPQGRGRHCLSHIPRAESNFPSASRKRDCASADKRKSKRYSHERGVGTRRQLGTGASLFVQSRRFRLHCDLLHQRMKNGDDVLPTPRDPHRVEQLGWMLRLLSLRDS